MTRPIDNQHVIEIKPLPSPREVKTQLPISDDVSELVFQTRQAIRNILHGRDMDRLIVIVGPCSIHDPDAAYEYADRLKPVVDAVRDKLLIVMRTYFEKPRMLNINGKGLPCATELLDPVTPQYIADLLSWTAIGARTTESQIHREMASGLSMPVGFKNGTEGSLQVAINAMITSRSPHHFVGVNADGITSIIKTTGNPDHHIVLRGGGGRTNYSVEDIARAEAAVASEGLARGVMVDCSHDNSGKNHQRQVEVAGDVLKQFQRGRRSIMGLMLESHLEGGRQNWDPNKALTYGMSITDSCLGWSDTEELLYGMAESLAAKTV
ncbi:MAG: 3-deoxy-7-phosphoheptulonate synthase [Nitrospira sp. NTP1]|nr:3-deoxy-7-phosphoheptulonate synthase [Nitrospira sp. NTP1]